MNISAEVIVVGAGLAGTSVAAVLGRQGQRVILVDARSTYPPAFKAEKIDQEQVILLRRLGLLEPLLPYCGRVRKILKAFDGRVFRTIAIEQYGISYPDMVNALRTHMPAGVECRLGRVEAIANSTHVQRVKIAGGEEMTARLVVLASGASRDLLPRLGLQRRVLQRDQSVVFGFTIAAPESQDFDFDSVTYYSLDPSACIDYLTLFRFRQTMRANLFVFRSARDPWVREFIVQPKKMLWRYLPKLNHVTGEFRIVDKVECGRVDLYQVDGNPQPGVVMIGDAYQSVCPSTGMGLDKVLTDVDVLTECIPHWLATPGMEIGKLADFYNHPRKLDTDSRALHRAIFQRRAITDRTLRWRLRRFLRQIKWNVLSAMLPHAPLGSVIREA